MEYKEMLTCPFCGGGIEVDDRTVTVGHGEYVDKAYVKCLQCHATGPVIDNWDYPKLSREERMTKAVEEWNKRREPKVVQECKVNSWYHYCRYGTSNDCNGCPTYEKYTV